MHGTLDQRHTERNYNANEAKADYTNISQPLCFAFIDPLPKNIGDSVDDAADWYREQVAKYDRAGEAAYEQGSSTKDSKREYYSDVMASNIDGALASCGR